MARTIASLLRRPAPLGALLTTLALAACTDRDAASLLGPDGPSMQVASAPVVNSLDDPGDGTCDDTGCTLREAIAFASSGATITFETGLSGTITLGNWLTIAKYLTISGPGADQLAVSGDEATLVFWITGGHSTISGLTIRDGLGFGNGGGGVVVTNSGTTATLENCVLENNTAGPMSYHMGGALWLNSGTDVTLSSCTLSGNTAPDLGQAIYQYGGSLTILNSTITGHGPGTGKEAVYKYAGTTRIDHSTITGNGVGLKLSASGSDVTVKGSIISGNTSADVYGSSTGGVTSLGYNLIGTSGANFNVLPAFSATGDQTGVTDPGLAPLALNSPGSTPTHALLAGSAAVDTGVCTDIDGTTLTVDQRGVTRPQGSACDMGAYELEANGGPTTPEFGFDLEGLSKTYGDPSFSVAGAPYVTTNSTGQVTFALGDGSVGCTVSSAGEVTITGAAVDPAACIIEASLAEASPYGAAGPISQSFNIAKASTTVSISNLPASGGVTGGFTPEYTSTSDGAKSTTSSTTAVCTVKYGYVSFVGVGTCTLTAHVAEGTNWLAADGGAQNIEIAGLAPDFTFDLSGLGTVTYGEAPFSVASYAATNSSGAITFTAGAGSTGCSVNAVGEVTITGSAVDPAACIIEASLAEASPYAAAGPVSQSFNIARANPSLTIGNLPSSGVVGSGFTPTVVADGDGTTSVTSSTTDVCTVDGAGAVSFDAVGTCILVAHVAEGTNYLLADWTAPGFELVEGGPGEFNSSCTYRIHPRSRQLQVTIEWANASPGVSLIELQNGVTVTKELTPEATGTWNVNLKGEEGAVSYALWGAERKKDDPTPLLPLTACTEADASLD